MPSPLVGSFRKKVKFEKRLSLYSDAHAVASTCWLGDRVQVSRTRRLKRWLSPPWLGSIEPKREICPSSTARRGISPEAFQFPQYQELQSVSFCASDSFALKRP